MSDYVTPESDHTRIHYVQRVTSNGPYGYREDETEYGVLRNGQPVTCDNKGTPYATTVKRDAADLADSLREMNGGRDTVEIIHRRVTRHPWFLTTPYRPGE